MCLTRTLPWTWPSFPHCLLDHRHGAPLQIQLGLAGSGTAPTGHGLLPQLQSQVPTASTVFYVRGLPVAAAPGSGLSGTSCPQSHIMYVSSPAPGHSCFHWGVRPPWRPPCRGTGWRQGSFLFSKKTSSETKQSACPEVIHFPLWLLSFIAS